MTHRDVAYHEHVPVTTTRCFRRDAIERTSMKRKATSVSFFHTRATLKREPCFHYLAFASVQTNTVLIFLGKKEIYFKSGTGFKGLILSIGHCARDFRSIMCLRKFGRQQSPSSLEKYKFLV